MNRIGIWLSVALLLAGASYVSAVGTTQAVDRLAVVEGYKSQTASAVYRSAEGALDGGAGTHFVGRL